jgi:myo-inositol 2-dehydrogenase/D-chiro-inositol 1-dehydrogenase
MKKAGIGLVGTGFMGRAHAGCYVLDGRVEMKAVSSLEEDQGGQFIRDFGFDRYSSDWQTLLDDPEIDIIDITVPNFLHGEIAIAAARAGKAIIVEKPLATSMEEADRVMAAVNEAGVLAMYAENRRFAPVFYECRERIENGELGAIKLFRINEMGSGPGHAGWYRNITMSGGGALIDMGIHGLGLAEWLVGELITSVSAMRTPGEGAEETVVTSARFASGALGQFVCSWGIQGGLDIRAELYGDKGTLMVDHSKTAGGLRSYSSEELEPDPSRPHASSTSGWSYPPVDEWNIKGHRSEIRHFVDCFLDDSPCRSTFKDGYRALQLAHAIYESAEKGREIQVEAGE